jgi:hypothetical protein
MPGCIPASLEQHLTEESMVGMIDSARLRSTSNETMSAVGMNVTKLMNLGRQGVVSQSPAGSLRSAGFVGPREVR